MDRRDLEQFKGEFVAIGVDHILDRTRLFFNYGTVIKLTDTTVVLRWKKGIKEILIVDIREIRLDRRRDGS